MNPTEVPARALFGCSAEPGMLAAYKTAQWRRWTHCAGCCLDSASHPRVSKEASMTLEAQAGELVRDMKREWAQAKNNLVALEQQLRGESVLAAFSSTSPSSLAPLDLPNIRANDVLARPTRNRGTLSHSLERFSRRRGRSRGCRTETPTSGGPVRAAPRRHPALQGTQVGAQRQSQQPRRRCGKNMSSQRTRTRPVALSFEPGDPGASAGSPR